LAKPMMRHVAERRSLRYAVLRETRTVPAAMESAR
jgi:hypothetical protein